jgi:hypothetical protein
MSDLSRADNRESSTMHAPVKLNDSSGRWYWRYISVTIRSSLAAWPELARAGPEATHPGSAGRSDGDHRRTRRRCPAACAAAGPAASGSGEPRSGMYRVAIALGRPVQLARADVFAVLSGAASSQVRPRRSRTGCQRAAGTTASPPQSTCLRSCCLRASERALCRVRWRRCGRGTLISAVPTASGPRIELPRRFAFDAI